MFEKLKKRYSKKRQNVKKVSRSGSRSRSGSGVAETSPALTDLQKYSFMEWLNKYTRPKKTKTNLMDDDESIPDSNQDQGELENEMESDSESNYELPDDKSTLGSNEKVKQNTQQTTAPRKKEQSLKKKAERTSKESTDQNLKENMTKLKDQTSEDEIIGQLIASELSSIPANDTLFIKHEINEVIFD